MRVLILGKTGQLARELEYTQPDLVQGVYLSRSDIDFSHLQEFDSCIDKYQPDLVINAVAYTAVDHAETEQDLANAVNVKAVAVIASACERAGVRLLHVSTDFIFDGNATSPYKETSCPRPLSVYGSSKLAGEHRIAEVMTNFAIVRTSWVYSAHGRNFLKTMLSLMASRDKLTVIDDQYGTPTSARSLARACWAIGIGEHTGFFHYTDGGHTTWFGFACEIYREALRVGILSRDILLAPIATTEYPTPATRPKYSVLDKSKIKRLGVQIRPWQQELADVIKEFEKV